jgi:hypothetical protein
VGVPAYQNVNIKLSLHGSQGFKIAPRDDLVSMNQANFKVPYLNDLGLRELCYIYVKISTDSMHL